MSVHRLAMLLNHRLQIKSIVRIPRMRPGPRYGRICATFIVTSLRQANYQVSIQRVPYEFQRGGNEMMRILKR